MADIDVRNANRMVARKSAEQKDTMLTDWLNEGVSRFAEK